MTQKIQSVKHQIEKYSKKTKQALKKKNNNKRHDVNLPIPNFIKLDMEAAFIALEDQKSILNTLNVLVRLDVKHGQVFVAQGKIGKFIGCSRGAACKAVDLLRNIGFIKTFIINNNGFDILCYKIDNDFYTNEVKSFLYKYVPACLKLFKLFSFGKQLLDEHVTPIFSNLTNYRNKRDERNHFLFNHAQVESVYASILQCTNQMPALS